MEAGRQSEFRVHCELTLTIDNNDYQPDVSVYKKKKFDYIGEEDTTKTEEMPLLAIEVVLPSQTMEGLIRKANFYLESGIQSVWIVHSPTHAVIVKTKSETKHYHEGILEDVTGVKVDMGIIFED